MIILYHRFKYHGYHTCMSSVRCMHSTNTGNPSPTLVASEDRWLKFFVEDFLCDFVLRLVVYIHLDRMKARSGMIEPEQNLPSLTGMGWPGFSLYDTYTSKHEYIKHY